MGFLSWRQLRPLTIHARVRLLVIACLLPVWLATVLTTYFAYDRERNNVGRQTLALARSLMAVVEKDLSADKAALEVLATSPYIDRGDFAAFYRQAQQALAYTSGFTIALTDASAQQVINLLQPYGASLPRHGSPELLQRVLATRKAEVSDLFLGGVTRQLVVAVEVPVVRDGKARYSLALGIDPQHLATLLRQQDLPPDSVVSIFDRQGTIIARNRAGENFVGHKAASELLRRMQEVPEGMIASPTLEGIAVLAAFTRSSTDGWSVAIGVPEAQLTAELRRWLGFQALGAVALLLGGLWLADAIGRRIARPIQSLIPPAMAIGDGEPVTVPLLDLQEADEVGQALTKAQRLIFERGQERDSIERTLRESEARHRSLFDNMQEGLAYCRAVFDGERLVDFTYIEVNAAFARLTGLRDVVGKNVTEVIPGIRESDPGLFDIYGRVAAGGAPEKFETHVAALDMWFAVSVYCPAPGYFVAVFDVITARKQVELALQAAKTNAERANKAKSRFLAAASHDLRQPLTALGLYIGVIGGKLPPEDAALVRNMQECLNSLSDMLRNLLDLSKLEAGVVRPSLADFDVDELLDKLVSVHAPEAQMKGLSLRCRYAGLSARSDSVLVGRILGNLVSNAIRFTRSGGVLIGCRRRGGRMWLEVWDTGIGIPADRIEEIFEEFKQLGNEERNQAKGSGLGLAIAAKTAALLGLQLRVRSCPGRGSVFALELPLGKPVWLVPREKLEHRPLRIALVEDNASVAQALAYSLAAIGHEVVAAASGAELLARLDGQAPAIVVSDYRLAAGETGFDVVSAVRAAFNPSLPSLIVTGDTDPALLRSMAARGIRLLHKPLEFEALRASIAELAQNPSS